MPTNKDIFFHYYSVNDIETKLGIVIGFFLRVIRICGPKFSHASFTNGPSAPKTEDGEHDNEDKVRPNIFTISYTFTLQQVVNKY